MSNLLHIIKETSTIKSRSMIDTEIKRLEKLVKYFILVINEDGPYTLRSIRNNLHVCKGKLKMYEQFKKNSRYYYKSNYDNSLGFM